MRMFKASHLFRSLFSRLDPSFYGNGFSICRSLFFVAASFCCCHHKTFLLWFFLFLWISIFADYELGMEISIMAFPSHKRSIECFSFSSFRHIQKTQKQFFSGGWRSLLVALPFILLLFFEVPWSIFIPAPPHETEINQWCRNEKFITQNNSAETKNINRTRVQSGKVLITTNRKVLMLLRTRIKKDIQPFHPILFLFSLLSTRSQGVKKIKTQHKN